jgi:hypothetical protein
MQSIVQNCDVNQCAYNQSNECHAPSISIGSEQPMCDTFTEAAVSPEVAACHIADCQFNEHMACNASGIKVAWLQGHADCGTFSPRQ